MIRALGDHFERNRWSFIIRSSAGNLSSPVRKDLVDCVVEALENKSRAPIRRSRHATTWKLRVVGTKGESTTIFVKRLEAPQGLISRSKARFRAKPSEHVLQISEDLRRDGLGVPQVLLIGENSENGNEVVVMNEAPGFMLTRWMKPSHRTDLVLRRRILHKLGAEVARLHLSGYLHGDLTPYNVFATGDREIAITFIDHEGTRKTSRASVDLQRNRLRNLVQLGHFEIPGVSRTDKMRVFASYANRIGLSKRTRRRSMLRVAKMIERRRLRDRAIEPGTSQPAIIAKEGAARG